MSTPIQEKMVKIGSELKSEYFEREDVVDGCLTAILAKQNVLLVGPPGIAKSALINEACSRITGAEWFQWLLSKVTTLEEVLGPMSLKSLENDKFIRIPDHKLPTAHIAFLDEIFKCNSTTLNSLLGIINERVFHNDGQPTKVPLISVFGASNELPADANELVALYDRFMIRFKLQGIQEEGNFLSMMQGAGNNGSTQKTTITLDELAQAQEEVKLVIVPRSVLESILKIRKDLQKKGFYNSDRRFKQLLSILQASAWLRGSQTVNEDELEIFVHCLWDKPEDMNTVSEVVLDNASPLKTEMNKILLAAEELVKKYEKVRDEHGKKSRESISAGSACSSELKDLIEKIKELEVKATTAGKDVQKVKELLNKVEKFDEKIVYEIVGRA
jgi:MoxR-like ATPase